MKAPSGAQGRRWATMALGFALLAALVLVPQDLIRPARAALAVFGTAVIFWVFTRLDSAWVAFTAAVVLVPLNAADQGDLMAMLGHDIVWLMIGAFVIGGAFTTSGLAARVAGGMARRATTTGQLFWLTTLALIPLTFLIPSTSGRAAAAMPALNALPAGQRSRRAYALLVPVVILVATTAAFTGAGSHLLVEDLLVERLGDRFGFARWTLWGLPFAILSSAIACAVILRMFLTPDERRASIDSHIEPPPQMSSVELRVTAIVGLTLALWFTTGWHGLGIATVAVVALAAPGIGVMSFTAALKTVNWNLVLFVGSAMVLGQALIDTQAAGWLIEHLFALTGLHDRPTQAPELAVVAAISTISLVSHLFITSHVARAAALAPPFILIAQTAGLEPLAVLFIATVGMNYCVTMPVCSKALLLFQNAEGTTFEPNDLLRLSAVLAPLNLLLMVATYFVWWKWTGLALGG